MVPGALLEFGGVFENGGAQLCVRMFGCVYCERVCVCALTSCRELREACIRPRMFSGDLVSQVQE